MAVVVINNCALYNIDQAEREGVWDGRVGTSRVRHEQGALTNRLIRFGPSTDDGRTARYPNLNFFL